MLTCFVSLAHAHSLYPDLKTATYPLRDNKIENGAYCDTAIYAKLLIP